MARKFMSEIKGTIGNTLYNHAAEINVAKDKKSLVECCKRLLDGRTDKDTKDFLEQLESLNYKHGMEFVYNYLLAGFEGCRSIKI